MIVLFALLIMLVNAGFVTYGVHTKNWAFVAWASCMFIIAAVGYARVIA